MPRPRNDDVSATTCAASLRSGGLRRLLHQVVRDRARKAAPGYANFAIAESPLTLVLIEGQPGQPTVMDHLGVEVETGDQVAAATTRLAHQGLATVTEENTTCCYAVQDKVWVRGPGDEPWEVYVVKADADTMTESGESTCCTGDVNAGADAVAASCC